MAEKARENLYGATAWEDVMNAGGTLFQEKGGDGFRAQPDPWEAGAEETRQRVAGSDKQASKK